MGRETEQYDIVDAVVLAEENHFDPQNSYREQAVIDRVDPEYVLLEKDNQQDLESVLEQESYSILGRDVDGRSEFFDYLHQRIEEDDLEEVVFCDDLPDGINPFIYAIMSPDSEQRAAIDEHRERYMSKQIAQYADKTDKPVVAIVGADHAREGSLMRDELEEYDIDYTVDFLPDTTNGRYTGKNEATVK